MRPKLIGYGAFSKVFRQGNYVAKKINYENGIISVSSLREIVFLKYLESKHITKLSSVDDRTITMEYAGESLKSMIQRKTLSIDKVIDYTIQILHGLDFIHKHNIIHCDIKPDNILVNNNVVRICDFNISSVNNKNNKGDVYTICYRPLESIYGHYTEKSDIWALGCTIYEMYTGDVLFDCQKNNNQTVINMVIDKLGQPNDDLIIKYKLQNDIDCLHSNDLHNYESLQTSSNLKLTDNYVLNNILNNMLQYDYEQRPTAEQLLFSLGAQSFYVRNTIKTNNNYPELNELHKNNIISDSVYAISNNLLDYLLKFAGFTAEPIYQWTIACICSMLSDGEQINFYDNLLCLDILPDIDFGLAISDILTVCDYNLIHVN